MFSVCFYFCLNSLDFIPDKAESKLIRDGMMTIEDKNILDEDIVNLDEADDILDRVDFM